LYTWILTAYLFLVFFVYLQSLKYKVESIKSVLFKNYLLFSLALQAIAGYGLLISRGFLITHNDAPQLVGLLWTSDQLIAETST
jgi:hypothetical protein